MHPNIELYINELVLHGLSIHDRYAIAEAVQSELTRLFTEQGIPSSISEQKNISSLRAGAFNFQQPTSDVTVGNNIASSVYKGFTNNK